MATLAPGRGRAATAVPRWRAALTDHVACLAVAPGGALVAAGSLGGDTVVLDTLTGVVVARLPEHPLGVLSLDWSPGGVTLAAGGQDGRITLWNRASRTNTTVELPGWVASVAWSPDSRMLAAAGGREVAVVRPDGGVVARYGGHASTVTSVCWAPRGGRLAAACYGGIRWYQPASRTDASVGEYGWKGSILVVAISPDGRWLASGNQDSTSKVWEISSDEELEMGGYPAKVERLAWEHQGHDLAVASNEVVMIWHCGGRGPEGTRPVVLETHTDRITDLRYQPAGPLLATVARDGIAAVWNPSRRRRPVRAIDTGGPLSCVAWAGDAALLAGTAGGEVLRLHVEVGARAPRR
jgi:WD40 repeat protein